MSEESQTAPQVRRLFAFVPEIRGMSSGSIPLPCEKIKSICTLFSKLAEAMGEKKKKKECLEFAVLCVAALLQWAKIYVGY